MGFLKYVGQLVSIAIVFVLVEAWIFEVDVSARMATLAQRFTDASKDDHSIVNTTPGVPAGGQIREVVDGVGKLIYPGETVKVLSVLMLHLGADPNEDQNDFSDELFTLVAEPTVSVDLQSYIGCGGQETDVAVIVDGSQQNTRLLGRRAFVVGVSPFSLGNAPGIVLMYADEDTDGDKDIDCQDGVEVALFGPDGKLNWQPNLKLRGDGHGYIALSRDKFLIQSYGRDGTTNTVFDVSAQTAGPLMGSISKDATGQIVKDLAID